MLRFRVPGQLSTGCVHDDVLMTCRATWPAVRTNLMLRVTLFAVLALAYAEEAAPEESPTDALPTIEVPATVDGAMFFEPFLPSWEKVWKVSKDADFSGRWKLESYAMGGEDTGLVVSDPARKHAVSTIFDKAFDPKGKGLVIQYELQLKNGLQCGGACKQPAGHAPAARCTPRD